jgi:hypothetical protein
MINKALPTRADQQDYQWEGYGEVDTGPLHSKRLGKGSTQQGETRLTTLTPACKPMAGGRCEPPAAAADALCCTPCCKSIPISSRASAASSRAPGSKPSPCIPPAFSAPGPAMRRPRGAAVPRGLSRGSSPESLTLLPLPPPAPPPRLLAHLQPNSSTRVVSHTVPLVQVSSASLV